jgi:hypothetical protein
MNNSNEVEGAIFCETCNRQIDPEDDDYHVWIFMEKTTVRCAACCPGCGECKNELNGLLEQIERLIDEDPDVGTPSAMRLNRLVSKAQRIEAKFFSAQEVSE